MSAAGDPEFDGFANVINNNDDHRDTITRTDGGNWQEDGIRIGRLIQVDSVLYKVNEVTELTIVLTTDGALTTTTGTTVTVQPMVESITFTTANWFEEVSLGINVDETFLTGQTFVRVEPFEEHRVDRLDGPLVIEGGVAEGKDRSLRVAVMLPTESTEDPLPIELDIDETQQADRLNVFNDSSTLDDRGLLAPTTLFNDIIKLGDTVNGINPVHLSGLGMGSDAIVETTEVTFANDPVETGIGTVTRTDGESWSDVGFLQGQFVQIDGTTNDGLYRIADVDDEVLTLSGVAFDEVTTDATLTVDGLTLDISDAQDGSNLVTIPFGITFDDVEVTDIMLGQGNDRFDIEGTSRGTFGAEQFLITVVHGGGNKVLETTAELTFSDDTITHPDTNWVDLGYKVGQHLRVVGGDNEGLYEIADLAGQAMTLAGAAFDPETAEVTVSVTGDTIVATGADPESPLVLFGDTSQDASRYDIEPANGDFTGNAVVFNTPGNDVIDASDLVAVPPVDGDDTWFLPVTIYGGAGNDLLIGSQAGDHIAGGSGDDLIFAQDGVDHVYGDSGFNVDYEVTVDETSVHDVARLLTVPTVDKSIEVSRDGLVAGSDEIHGEGGDDIVFGDHGVIDQADGTLRILTTGSVTRIATDVPDNAADDDLFGNAGRDRLLGGGGGDDIDGGEQNNVVIGDHGFIDLVVNDADLTDVDVIQTTQPTIGGVDTITTGSGNDIILGGTAGDTVRASAGNDLVFGDHGKIEGNVDGAFLPLEDATPEFTFLAIDTQNTDGGGNDTIFGEAGEDILLGQQGADTIRGGSDDDDIIGGHNVAGGHDTGDFLDGGFGNDVILGDNAVILRRDAGDTASPRMRALAGTVIYGEDVDAGTDGVALVTLFSSTLMDNPNDVQARYINVLDHSDTPTANTSGDDYIAGGPQDDVIFGQLGDDVIQGRRQHRPARHRRGAAPLRRHARRYPLGRRLRPTSTTPVRTRSSKPSPATTGTTTSRATAAAT